VRGVEEQEEEEEEEEEQEGGRGEVNRSLPSTPSSSSTPYRQLKRLHSTQVGPSLRPVATSTSEINKVPSCLKPTSCSSPPILLRPPCSPQNFDEAGRRMATPSRMTSSIGLRLFSRLDDGTGHAPVDQLLDAWLDEGIENTSEILKVLTSADILTCFFRLLA